MNDVEEKSIGGKTRQRENGGNCLVRKLGAENKIELQTSTLHECIFEYGVFLFLFLVTKR